MSEASVPGRRRAVSQDRSRRVAKGPRREEAPRCGRSPISSTRASRRCWPRRASPRRTSSSAWPEIVGERLAPYCEPVKMQWPRRPAGLDRRRPQEPATLVVRVEGAFALELQHLAPVIIERVNAHYGWRCVGTARRSGRGRSAATRCERATPPRAGREGGRARRAARVRRRRRTSGLREALVRLGAGILHAAARAERRDRNHGRSLRLS